MITFTRPCTCVAEGITKVVYDTEQLKYDNQEIEVSLTIVCQLCGEKWEIKEREIVVEVPRPATYREQLLAREVRDEGLQTERESEPGLTEEHVVTEERPEEPEERAGGSEVQA